MALRVKEIEVGGHKLRIANLQLRSHRDFSEGLARVKTMGELFELTRSAAIASLTRADPAFTPEKLDELGLDFDDLKLLGNRIMDWTWSREEQKPPEGVAASGGAASP